MNTDGISSRFGVLGPYGGSPLEDPGTRPRSPDSRAQAAAPSAQLRMSAWPAPGQMSLAQGIQAGVAAAQAGLLATEFLETAAARPALPPRVPDGGSGASAARTRPPTADTRPSGVPVALADLLAMAPQAADRLRDAGSDLQAWLDIATGRLALQAAQEVRGRAEPVPPESEPAPAPEPTPAPARRAERRAEAEPGSPSERVVERPVPPPRAPQASAELPRLPEQEEREQQQEEQTGVGAALAQARRSFTSALERLDARLEPALATALSGLGGQEALAAAESVADRMRRQPERALETHQAVQLPGVLGLLRWNLTPLGEPLPEPGAG